MGVFFKTANLIEPHVTVMTDTLEFSTKKSSHLGSALGLS